MMLISVEPKHIAVLLHLSLATVYRVWAHYQTFGVVRKQDRHTRLSGFTVDDARFADRLVTDNPHLYLDEYRGLFEEERGKAISTSVLLRIFHVSSRWKLIKCSYFALCLIAVSGGFSQTVDDARCRSVARSSSAFCNTGGWLSC